MTEPTFLFYDFETWGADPKRDYPCQFAAIRTDMALNEVDKPVDIMCRIPNDYLPHPKACLVTGIVPQKSLQMGVIESEFASQIHAQMSKPSTCSVGYNSIRFDDEVCRFMFYRNFIDPYSREWQNGNSRWDIIDLVRACYALRPEGLQWCVDEDDIPSFKLERLTQANDIEHGDAHDALADVRATIGIAKRIKDSQPKLFEYYLSLRNKQNVASFMQRNLHMPILHISSKFPSSQGCASWVVPIGRHPEQQNAYVCVDLTKHPDLLIDESTQDIRERLFASNDQLDDPTLRPGLKLVHLNKSPFVTTAKALSAERAKQLGLDREQCLANFQVLKQHFDQTQTWLDVFLSNDNDANLSSNPETGLYRDGFLSPAEKDWSAQVRHADANQLELLKTSVPTSRLEALLFRYRARNFPQTLSRKEMEIWQRHREVRLRDGIDCLSIDAFAAELDLLAIEVGQQPKALSVLTKLQQYAQSL